MVQEHSETFPKEARIRKRREYLEVMGQGRKFVTHRLVFFCTAWDSRDARLGVTVSRRVGNAVVRNRVKRRIREIFRRRRTLLPEGLRLVVVARKTSATSDNVALEDDFVRVERWMDRRKPRGRL